MVPPSSAWEFGGGAVARYIEAILSNALSGIAFPPPQPEKVFFARAPEGVGNEEKQRTRNGCRRPKVLRPLTLQNEDQKSVAGILNHSLLPTVVSSCSILQRGLFQLGSLSKMHPN